MKIVKLKIKAKAIEKIKLPDYSGNVFRGNFGHSFKDVACLTLKKNCEKCEQKSQCAYIKIFETEYPETAKQVKRMKQVPKPYVINPPAMNITELEEGKNLYFGLTLIGTSVDYLPYFVFSFKEMGKAGIGANRGKFIIEDVLAYLPDDENYHSIFKAENQKLINVSDNYHITFNNDSNNTENSNQVALKFISPTNIVVDKSSKHNMEFYPLFSRLISRINALSLLYCGEELTDNYLELIEKSKEISIKENSTSWYQIEKYSSRQHKRFQAGGYLGEVVYQGELNEFLPYLEIGQYVNVGKNTTIGFGKYEIKD